jgi:hypothetical protein
MSFRSIPVVAASAILFLASAAHAQLFRTYLASDGNDANPCTLAQPCRLLPAALAALASGGEIWMLDSANYNTTTVDVTKSVTILAVPGALGSVVTNNATAISISTAGVRVALRNLVFARVAGTSGADGLNVGSGASGAEVRVEKCHMAGLGLSGIVMGADGRLYVTETIIRDSSYGIRLLGGSSFISTTQLIGNTNVGLHAAPADGATVVAYLDNVVASFNGYGIATYGLGASSRFSRVYVSRSVSSGNLYNGFQSYSDGAITDSILEISDSVAAGNGAYGLYNVAATLRSNGNNRSTGNAAGAFGGAITVTASY